MADILLSVGIDKSELQKLPQMVDSVVKKGPFGDKLIKDNKELAKSGKNLQKIIAAQTKETATYGQSLGLVEKHQRQLNAYQIQGGKVTDDYKNRMDSLSEAKRTLVNETQKASASQEQFQRTGISSNQILKQQSIQSKLYTEQQKSLSDQQYYTS